MNNHSNRHCNTVIIENIPLPKDLKSYWVRVFTRWEVNNGAQFAAQKMKNLRETIMSYISDPNRLRDRTIYVRTAGVRRNMFLYMLFEYAETQPYDVLNLLKMYTYHDQPLVSVEESALTMQEYLTSRVNTIREARLRPVFTQVGRILGYIANDYFLENSMDESKLDLMIHELDLILQSVGFQRAGRTRIQARAFWLYLARRLFFIPHYEYRSTSTVVPSLYKDYQPEHKSSLSFSRDLYQYSYLKAFLLSDTEQSLIEEGLSLEDRILIKDISDKEVPEEFRCNLDCVGQVHHIPKKGTTDRRPIAVPNRFLQRGLEPLARYLYRALFSFPLDATFDQSRFDAEIVNRMKADRYVGSVDLSHATDNLPYSWTRAIFDPIINLLPEEIQVSYQLFNKMLTYSWNNEGSDAYWEIGQPLGSLPSFAMLGLTHNLIAYLAAYIAGRKASHYVLGDDIIFTDRVVRKRYMEMMKYSNIPLSLHKSYDERMCEFAGKIYIKNQIPRYSSDHNVITWNSLFDYQRSTRTRFRYGTLPKQIRHKWTRKFVTPQEAETAYNIVSVYNSSAIGESVMKYWDHPAMRELISYAYSQKEENIPALYSENFSFEGLLTHSGKELVTNNWYEQKFRPCSTDAFIDFLNATRQLQ